MSLLDTPLRALLFTASWWASFIGGLLCVGLSLHLFAALALSLPLPSWLATTWKPALLPAIPALLLGGLWLVAWGWRWMAWAYHWGDQ